MKESGLMDCRLSLVSSPVYVKRGKRDRESVMYFLMFISGLGVATA